MIKVYLTRKEAAELLGVSVQTISNYVRDGLLVESSTKGQNLKMGRILGSSVENLLSENYDVVEQAKAIEILKSNLSDSYKDYKKERDILHNAHNLLKISNSFHKNLSFIAELLSAWLVSEGLLTKAEMKVCIDILCGHSLQLIAEDSHIPISRVNEIYKEAIKKLIRKRTVSYNDIDNENRQLKERLQLELDKTRELEQQVNDLVNQLNISVNVLKIPVQLIGKQSIMSFSNRLFNALLAFGIENLYDLALINKKQLLSIRNIGRKCYDEVYELMSKYWILFDDINSLNNHRISSLPGPFVEIPISELLKRRQMLHKLH